MRYLILLAASASLAVTPPKVEPWPRKIKPVMVWAGTDNNKPKKSFDRCCSQKEWEAAWHKHQGGGEEINDRTCPKIDFDSYMVIAIFQGGSLKDWGVNVHSILEEKDCIRIQFGPPSWQTGFFLKEGEGDKYADQSFAFIVLPKSGKAILFDEDVRSCIDAPPEWKERAKLAALGKN